jgi:hypothetical protein
MIPIIIILLPIAGLIFLGFWFYLRRGKSLATIIRMYVARFLAVLATIFVFTGILSPFFAASIQKVHWGLAVTMVAFGLLLGFCSARVDPNK